MAVLSRHRGFLLLLAVGAALRILLAFVVFPGQGLAADLNDFQDWAIQLSRVGPGDFYATVTNANYPPAYLAVLWLLGGLGSPLGSLLGTTPAEAILLMIKVPALLADLGIAVLLYRAGWHWFDRRAGLMAAGLYLLVPVTWYDSAVWGQVDAAGALLMLGALLALADGWSEAALSLGVLSVLVKPQDAIVLVVLVPVLVRRHLLRPDSGPVPRSATRLAGRHPRWVPLLTDQGPARLGTSLLAAAATVFVTLAPFDIQRLAPASLADIPFVGQIAGLVSLFASDTQQFAVLTANAFNIWALIGAHPLASVMSGRGGGWTPDSVLLAGEVPAVLVGAGLLGAAGLLVFAGLLRRDDRLAILAGFTLLAFAFYALPTRVHERYLLPAFASGALMAAGGAARAAAYLGVGALNVVNLHAVLAGAGAGFGLWPGTLAGPGRGGAPPGVAAGTPGVATAQAHAASVSLPLAALARSDLVVTAVALGQTLAFVVLLIAWIALLAAPHDVWGIIQLRRRAGTPGPAA
jgi:hypothetical protein